MSWGAMEQAGGCVLQASRALTKTTCWPGPGFEVMVNLSPIPACKGSDLSLWVTVGRTWSLPPGWPEEPRASWILGTWLPQRRQLALWKSPDEIYSS